MAISSENLPILLPFFVSLSRWYFVSRDTRQPVSRLVSSRLARLESLLRMRKLRMVFSKGLFIWFVNCSWNSFCCTKNSFFFRFMSRLYIIFLTFPKPNEQAQGLKTNYEVYYFFERNIALRRVNVRMKGLIISHAQSYMHTPILCVQNFQQ